MQMPGIMVPGIGIVNHLKNEQVKAHYSYVSATQMFTIQILTELRAKASVTNGHNWKVFKNYSKIQIFLTNSTIIIQIICNWKIETSGI